MRSACGNAVVCAHSSHIAAIYRHAQIAVYIHVREKQQVASAMTIAMSNMHGMCAHQSRWAMHLANVLLLCIYGSTLISAMAKQIEFRLQAPKCPGVHLLA